MRVLDVILVAAVLGGAVWTFQIKHSAEQSAKRIAGLSKQIEAERNKITLLRADWAIVTSPERLEGVARSFEEQLSLKRLRSDQIANMNELPPLRPLPQNQLLQAMEKDDGEAEMTGSVGRSPDAPITTPTPRGGR